MSRSGNAKVFRFFFQGLSPNGLGPILEWCGIENMEYSQFQWPGFSSVLDAFGHSCWALNSPWDYGLFFCCYSLFYFIFYIVI